MNKVILEGRLGADPETKGNGVVRMRLATNRRKKIGDEWQDVTDWHTVVAFGKTGETAARFLSKGREVLIEGSIEYREHEGKWYTSILCDRLYLIGGRGESAQRQDGNPNLRGGYGSQDDGIPF